MLCTRSVLAVSLLKAWPVASAAVLACTSGLAGVQWREEELALLGVVGGLEFSIVEELRSSACAPARMEAESRPGPGRRAELLALSSGDRKSVV